MLCYCPLSGTEFRIQDSFNKIGRQEAIHPTFNLSLKTLLSIYPQWVARKLSDDESKILFLAFLRHTELVEFRTTAMPSVKIVSQNMESIKDVANWKVALSGAQTIKLPHFAVTYQDRDLQNIAVWVQAWRDARQNWRDEYKQDRFLDKLKHREEILQRLVHSHTRNEASYLRQLGEWAMASTGVPVDSEFYNCWMPLFKLDPNKVPADMEVYNKLHTGNLTDLLEHLVKELDLTSGSLFAQEAVDHVRKLHHHNTGGFLHMLSGDPTFSFTSDPIEDLNRKAASAGAPIDEPRAVDFPSRLAYLRAKNAWQLSVQGQAKIASWVKKQGELELEVNLDAINAAEEAEISEDLDLSQFGV